jgi:hypothetical protein
MKALISSCDAKITSARSPIIPAPTRAGAPLLRTIVADIGLEAQIALPEIANLAVGGRNLVSIPATSAAHLIAALRGLGRMAIERDLTAAAWDRR